MGPPTTDAAPPKYRRSRRLVLAGLQLKLAAAFALLAGISAVVQALVLVHALSSLAREVAQAESVVFSQASALVRQNILISLALLVPPFLIAGVLITFRIAGPIYRFQKYFEDLAKNGYSGPCTIRRGDELQDFCRTINRGIERLIEPDLPARPAAQTALDAVPAPLPSAAKIEIT